MLFVTVGSTSFDFSRLFVELDRLASIGLIDTVVAQIGGSSYTPTHYKWQRYFPMDELHSHINRADCVICHSGCGTLDECLGLQKILIVVPRRADLNEAPDNHQIEVLTLLSKLNIVLVANETNELEERIREAKNWVPQFRPAKHPTLALELINIFIQENFEAKLLPLKYTEDEKTDAIVKTDGDLSYVLVTAARNEAGYIENTIKSVISQTVRPRRWVIVSDGSTDGTDEIVKRYVELYPWIMLLRMPSHEGRDFAAKAQCVATAWNELKNTTFDLIANIDADITFEQDYFAFILDKFWKYRELGVAGTPYFEDSHRSHAHQAANYDDVPGQCQFFRRGCFEAVGGYQPIKEGGEDTLAVTTARMKGWLTRTFTGKAFYHQRRMGTEGHGASAAFFLGQRDYLYGNDLFWELLRSLLRIWRKPYIIQGTFLFAGFCWSAVRMRKRLIHAEVRAFRRREQRSRLLEALNHLLHLKRLHCDDAIVKSPGRCNLDK